MFSSQLPSAISLSHSAITSLFNERDITVSGLKTSDKAAINAAMRERQQQPAALTSREQILREKHACALDYTICMALSWVAIKLLEKICLSPEEGIPDYAQNLKRLCQIGGIALLGLAMFRGGQAYSANRNATTGIYLANAVAAGRARVYLEADRSQVTVVPTSNVPMARELELA